jgi:hypothetical protein
MRKTASEPRHRSGDNIKIVLGEIAYEKMQ